MSTIDNSSLLGEDSHALDHFLEYVRRVRPQHFKSCNRYTCLDSDERVHSMAYYSAMGASMKSAVYRELLRFASSEETTYRVRPGASRDTFFIDDLKYDAADAADAEISRRTIDDPRHRLLSARALALLRGWMTLVAEALKIDRDHK